MYKLDPLNSSGKQETVHNTVTGFHIPFDPANTDYQEYLAWVAEGNTPAPPDEPETP